LEEERDVDIILFILFLFFCKNRLRFGIIPAEEEISNKKRLRHFIAEVEVTFATNYNRNIYENSC